MTASLVTALREVGVTDEQILLLQQLNGGRAFWVPEPPGRDWEAVRKAIRADPCRDWRVIMARYQVSRGFVYRVWTSKG